MTKKKRRNHPPSFKAKAVMAAIRGNKTPAEIARLLKDLEPHQS